MLKLVAGTTTSSSWLAPPSPSPPFPISPCRMFAWCRSSPPCCHRAPFIISKARSRAAADVLASRVAVLSFSLACKGVQEFMICSQFFFWTFNKQTDKDYYDCRLSPPLRYNQRCVTHISLKNVLGPGGIIREIAIGINPCSVISTNQPILPTRVPQNSPEAVSKLARCSVRWLTLYKLAGVLQ